MKFKIVGLMALACAMGFAGGVAVVYHGRSHESETELPFSRRSAVADVSQTGGVPIRADVSSGSGVNELAIVQVTPTQSEAVASGAKAPEELGKRMSFDEYKARRESADTAKLIAAGFSPDRLSWIKQRAVELEAEHAKEKAQRLASGLAPPVMNRAYIVDKDLGLRDAIGDDEYARYREALGRLTPYVVTKVNPNSNAARAGIQPMDEIVSFNGRRIFNFFQLDAMTRGDNDDGSGGIVELKRNGKTVQLWIAGGYSGLQPSIYAQNPELAKKLGQLPP